MSADRVAARFRTAKFDAVTYKAGEAEEFLRKAYLALHSFKFGLDEMEEIPSHLKPIYDQMMKVLGHMHPVQQEAHQLTQMTSKMLRNMGR
jgi:flagellin-specific chaperone FliS